MNRPTEPEPAPIADPRTVEQAAARHRALAAGLMALPNLFLTSAVTLGLLYGMLGLVLIALVQFNVVGPAIAVSVGCAIILLSFVLGPWIMDLGLTWMRKLRWVKPEELPEHLRSFVARVCAEHKMRFPMFAVVDDGGPEAFTYGHHPSNARIVISRGLMELLTPGEVEAVVAHEIGHARNWDMALMTVANLVPLLLFYLYDSAIRYRDADDKKSGAAAIAVAVGAYVLYIISEYIVLWFSRTREYAADRFAGEKTGDPGALASALVKIAYGLAAGEEVVTVDAEGKQVKTRKKSEAGVGAFAALNIFDRSSAVGLAMTTANATEGGPKTPDGVDRERVKGAMQWDLWNPWAAFYELHSTHPLVARRLLALGDQAAAMGRTPYVVFDRVKPESYWDDFLVDLLVVALPTLGLLTGLSVFVAMGLLLSGGGTWALWPLGLAVLLMGLGSAVKSHRVYTGGPAEQLTVAALMHRVKVSPVRPIRATLTGEVIGKGVPGLVYSEDFVMRDTTGILFLDYQQPLGLWNFLFGLLRAGRYQGKKIRVTGWFRRAPTPYLEVDRMEVIDGSEPARRCYTSWMTVIWAWVLVAVGAGLTAFLAVWRP